MRRGKAIITAGTHCNKDNSISSANPKLREYSAYIRLLSALATLALLLELSALAGLIDRSSPVYLGLHVAETGSLALLLLKHFPGLPLLGWGMLASALGDLNNTGLTGINLIEPTVLQSVPLFALTHCCYILVFQRCTGVPATAFIVSGAVLALGPWYLSADTTAPLWMQCVTAAYALIIGAMLGSAVQLWRLMPVLWPVALGALLFVLSDLLIAVFWLGPDPQPELVRQWNWWLYFPAQLLIALLPLRLGASFGDKHGPG